MAAPSLAAANSLHELLAKATEPEQQMIRAILGGELRQGALDGVMAAAVAKAADVSLAEVQRGAMFAGSLATAAAGRPHRRQPGPGGDRAQSDPSGAADARLTGRQRRRRARRRRGSASVEWKLDGARIQAHRAAGDVRLYTRNLNEVTDRLGGVVEVVGALPGGDLVLDGEVLGVDDDGHPAPVPGHDGRLRRRRRIGAGRGHGPAGVLLRRPPRRREPIVDEPLAVRREMLAAIVPERSRLPAIVTADPDEARALPRPAPSPPATRA